MTRRLGYVLAGLLAAAVLVSLGFATGAVAPYLDGYDVDGDDAGRDGGYDHTTVSVVGDESGEELGRVEAAIADTFLKRYVGLSDTDRLPPDRGMLFVHDAPGEYTYVMRDMSFGLDIVFVAENRTITAIHHAPAPEPDEDGESQRYSGNGKYVLEVNRDWTTNHGVEVGDRLAFDLAA